MTESGNAFKYTYSCRLFFTRHLKNQATRKKRNERLDGGEWGGGGGGEEEWEKEEEEWKVLNIHMY